MGKVAANYQEEIEDVEGDENTAAFEENDEELEIESEGGTVEVEEEVIEEEVAPVVEEKPKYSFKNDDELEKFIASKKPMTPTPQKDSGAEDDVESLVFWKGNIDPETGKWVGEAPKDWNDFARTILKQVAPGKVAPKIMFLY